METTSKLISRVWLRRSLVIGFVIVYLGAGGFFLYSHLIGDTGRFAVGYLWTWDMFPNYPSFSARRLALGQTKRGDYVQVFPDSRVKYRRGGQRDMTRFDLPRNDAALRMAVTETLQLAAARHPENPIRYVFLIENSWPVRFNLPEVLYRSRYGEANPHRQAWRILDEGPVTAEGDVRWTSAE